MIAFLLVLLLEADPPAASVTSFYDFILALSDRPFVVAIGFGLAAILAALARRFDRMLQETRQEVAATRQAVASTHAELAEVHTQVNGHSAELRAAKEAAAFAQGELKGTVETAPALIEQVKPLVTQPTRTGQERTRVSDQEPTPSSSTNPFPSPPDKTDPGAG